MPVRSVVLAEHVHRADDLDARGVHRHEDLRLALVRCGVGVGLHHRDHDLAARIAGAGDVVLLAGDHPFVAVTHGLAGHVLRIRRRDVGLGHRVGRADLTVEQRREPLRLLLGRADSFEHLHVAGVRRGAVHRLRRQRVLAQLDRDVGVVEVRETLTGLGVGKEEVPQALRLGLVLDRLEQFELAGCIGPTISAPFTESEELGGDRIDLGVDELLHRVVQRTDALGHPQVVHVGGGFQSGHGASPRSANDSNLVTAITRRRIDRTNETRGLADPASHSERLVQLPGVNVPSRCHTPVKSSKDPPEIKLVQSST